MDNAIEKVRQLDRVKILDTNSNRVRAVFKYDRRLPNLSKIFTRNWRTMVEDNRRPKEVFLKPPMVCYQRGMNLREEICQAKLPPPRPNRQEEGFRRCNRSSCRLCSFTGLNRGEVARTLQIISTNEDLKIRGKLTCTTSNILYILTCSKEDRTCPSRPQYGGETGKSAE